MRAFLGGAYHAVLSKFTDWPSHLRFREGDGQTATAAPGDWVLYFGDGRFFRVPADVYRLIAR